VNRESAPKSVHQKQKQKQKQKKKQKKKRREKEARWILAGFRPDLAGITVD
jgi:hypothetical protein